MTSPIPPIQPNDFNSIRLFMRDTAGKLKEIDPNLNFDKFIIINYKYSDARYGPNLFKNYHYNTMMLRGVPAATLAWWTLRATASFYVSMATAALTPCLEALGTGALGFAAGVGLDQGQEALFGQSYTAAGVKAFLEQPAIWGSAEAAPKQLVDAWDKYFSWTNYPSQAAGWLKKNLE